MKLIVVGAGPKAASVVARAAAWRSVAPSRTVPELEVIEEHGPAAAWRGGYGFSDGALELCNAGEKDVGFPYPHGDDATESAEVSRHVDRCFSWFAFLTDIGFHTEWVERGRPFPNHALWARYIGWIFDKAGQQITRGRVTSAFHVEDLGLWSVTYEEGGFARKATGGALMLTGTGPANRLGSDCWTRQGLVDAQSFWTPEIQKRLSGIEEGTVVVIGSGGAAGTILAHLAQMKLHDEVGIVSVSQLGALFPRGDGYAERRWFSDSSDWAELPPNIRGVVSARIKTVVDHCSKIEFVYGRGRKVWAEEDGTLKIEVLSGDRITHLEAQLVVAALGFDAWGLLRVLGDSAKTLYAPVNQQARERREALEEQFKADLTVPVIAGIGPRLHVPLLAAFSQGPGLANLGCLGTIAKSVLDPYVL